MVVSAIRSDGEIRFVYRIRLGEMRSYLSPRLGIDRDSHLLTSVSDALVCLIWTLLLLVMVAQMEMASPGTYPPRSSRTRHVTGP